MSKHLETPRIEMSLETPSLADVSQTLAGVVAVDGGTIGLDVNFGAFLAVILGLFIPVVFLITLCGMPFMHLIAPPSAQHGPLCAGTRTNFASVPCPRRFIQSEAQGTAVSFRQPDSIGGMRYEDE